MPKPLYLLACGLLLVGMASAADDNSQTTAVDWQDIRRLMARERAGQTLTADERQRLEAGRAERRRLQEEGRWPPGASASATASGAVFLRGASTGLVPLTELGQNRYQDTEGGLYGAGSNEPTPAMREQEKRLLAAIEPRGRDGKPQTVHQGGRIGLVSIGMSNTNQEWGAFDRAMAADPRLAPGLVLVNGALGAHDVVMWGSGDDADPWTNLDRRLAEAGLTPEQVQAVWMKHAIRLPQTYGSWPGHVRATTAEMRLVIGKLSARLPNLRVIHLSSRAYGGWDEREQPASGEPFAYESAFAVRALILAQAGGEWSLNPDPQAGPVRAPLLRWGPYLWADGEKSRQDGVSWPRSHFKQDGTHPAEPGQDVVARLLTAFYLSDPSASWARRP